MNIKNIISRLPGMPALTAEAIQRELVDAEDRLMAEVNEILNAPAFVDAKAQRLQHLGFNQSSDTRRYQEAEAARQRAEQQGAHRRAAEARYPALKFIGEAAMDHICRKYRLLIGSVDRYTGTVPEWALPQIERVKTIVTHYGGQARRVNRSEGLLYGSYPSHAKPHASLERDWGFYDGLHTEDKELAEAHGMKPVHPTLLIAAPIHLMRHEKREVRGFKIIPVQDPIVCFYTEGGYMVLAAWGEEGRDPEVFNAENN
jgi:hypothetical protein